jgi:opacity protein-like surface antigen
MKDMNIKQGLFAMVGTFLGCAIATAGDMGAIISSKGLHPVVSLHGGFASINAGGNTQRFTGTDSEVFTYRNSGDGKNTDFIGVFLGAEHSLPFVLRPGFFIQTGIEYNYFIKVGVNGVNTVGIEPQTSTTYRYHYNFQAQQVLGTLRLFATTYERFHPYGEVGLGASFNHTGPYNATTTETGSVNLTPGFSNQSNTQFSYSLGLGVDAQVNTKTRVGFGYRYSNFGSSSLGNGTVTFSNYQSPVSFALGSSNTYANQLIARISYVA